MPKFNFRSQPSRILTFSVLLTFPLFLSATTAQNTPDEIAWPQMVMALLGGLALFLFGMDQLTGALKSIAGKRMKSILAKLTTNRVMAAITGSFVTAVIQSSSVTTVLVVGFVSAGLMTLTQSIGIIMGANIGTTVTAQIVAFKITKAALLLIAIGFALLFTGKSDRTRHTGGIIMGLGLVFYGMTIMSDAMAPLRSYEPFLDLMSQMENPLLGILAAAAFTALIQSSSATTGIVIVMASQGFITLPAGIAMALGANVGTCVTAMLAALGKPREALQAASVHVSFNIVGALLWVGFIPELGQFAATLSPIHDELSGAARLAAETPRQIANANTIFNIANTLLFLPLAGLFAAVVTKLIPLKPVVEEIIIKPRYLDSELLQTPSLALVNVRLELGHMGDLVIKQLEEANKAINKRDYARLKKAIKRDEKIDILHAAILDYLGDIQKRRLSDQESDLLASLLKAAIHLESIGDVIETDVAPLGIELVKQGVAVNSTTEPHMNRIFYSVKDAVENAVKAVRDTDIAAAEKVLLSKEEFRQLEKELRVVQHYNLGTETDDEFSSSLRGEVELLERLHYIHSLAKWIAKDVIPLEESAEAAA